MTCIGWEEATTPEEKEQPWFCSYCRGVGDGWRRSEYALTRPSRSDKTTRMTTALPLLPLLLPLRMLVPPLHLVPRLDPARMLARRPRRVDQAVSKAREGSYGRQDRRGPNAPQRRPRRRMESTRRRLQQGSSARGQQYSRLPRRHQKPGLRMYRSRSSSSTRHRQPPRHMDRSGG